MKNAPILTSALLAGLALCMGDATAAPRDDGQATVQAATCRLLPVGESGVTGEVRFERTDSGLHVTGHLSGLTPGEHGFHVHEWGDVSDAASGKSAGGHFAPDGNPHGRPEDAERHVGDLGNVLADESGMAKVDITDGVIALSGPHSIVGRAVVVHAGEDHFTQPSGEAGARVAFGVIGVANPSSGS